MSESRLAQAWELLSRNRFDLALDYAQQARRAGADPAGCMQCASLSLSGMGRHDEAIDAAHEALRLDASSAMSHNALGYACYQKAAATRPTMRVLTAEGTDYARLCERAEQAYREALRIEPSDPLYHQMLGILHFERERMGEAEASLRAALAIDPHRPDCLTLLSGIYQRKGRHAEAHACAAQALRVDANDSSGHAALGWAEMTSGDRKRAVELFREALRLDPNDQYARLGLIESIKVGNTWLGLPYRSATRGIAAAGTAKGRAVFAIGWSVLVFALCLAVWIAAGSAMAGWALFFPLVLLGLFALVVSLFLHSLAEWLQTGCNVLLLPHPLGRRALLASQRCVALELFGYPLTLVLAVVLKIQADLHGGGWSVASSWALGSVVLVAPVALWAAALTTRWVWWAGAFAAGSVAVFVLAMLGVDPMSALRSEGVGFGLVIAGVVACYLVPER